MDNCTFKKKLDAVNGQLEVKCRPIQKQATASLIVAILVLILGFFMGGIESSVGGGVLLFAGIVIVYMLFQASKIFRMKREAEKQIEKLTEERAKEIASAN